MAVDLDPEERRAVGQRRSRPEDAPLVRGEANYVDDFQPGDALHMAVVRSRYGAARVEGVDAAAAEAVDGVAAIYTATDLAADEAPGVVGPISGLSGVDDPDSPRRAREPLRAPERPLLAGERTHYTGEPVAVVLAADRYAAHEAAEALEVEYERLDTVTHPEEALAGDAPEVHGSVPGNLAFDWEAGDAAATDEAFAAADRTVAVDIAHQRVSPAPMESRAALAEYDPEAGRLTVRMGTQNPHRARRLMESAVGIPEEDVHVIAPEVGGGFGCKSKFYPAEPLAAWCAMRTGRPVKWQATRTEGQRSDIHGRGRTVAAELAFDDDGTMRGLRVDSHANLGAYVSRAAPGTRTGSFVDCMPGQYDVPAVHCRVRGVLTNTAPVDSYRGSSRPMTLLTVERLVNLAARELGADPAALRRRNFVPPEQFPHETPVGEAYDSGAYERALEEALELVGYEEWRERQRARRASGTTPYLGVGICGVLDNAGTGSTESARVRVDPDGSVTAYCGTADQGQGHRTAFAQLVADLLGVPFEAVTVVEGDTTDVPVGGGASGSRSVVMGGEAIRAASEAVVERARPLAAERLEVAPADLAFEAGEFRVTGAPERAVGLDTVAGVAADRGAVLEETVERAPPATFPFGTHVAVVEVTPETGAVEVVDYAAVDDCGVQLNPTLVEGQIVGGVVNGLGQALYEDAVYDDNATLVAGSLQDYALPKAGQAPAVRTGHTETPSPYNDLGVKGAGESGATAAPAALANAVADALAPLGIEHVDLPMTPERVWRAVEAARD